ncbi:MAG TPA: serine hydrolase [Clostridium sp.]|nr:serine hydrolase [Clostridium sp.]
MFMLLKRILCCLILMSVLGGNLIKSHYMAFSQKTQNNKDIELSTNMQLKNSITQNLKDVTDQEISEFLEEYINNKMEEYNVPGLEISVVRNNKEIFNKGYGYADLKERRRVDINKTTFPAASVSKLFTAVAIMQLYEQGKIDLDTDVNKYISPIRIQNKFDQPVTCRNLLTHSSGLDEEGEINTKTENIQNIKSQEYYFEYNKPVVILEPNTISRYSNQGYNILGFIVEKVSSASYEQYIEENILKPLNMNNTSVRMNDENMAKGYMDDNEESVPFSYQYTSGSSGIISTSSDMKNFMTAILNKGSFEGYTLLKPETVAMMECTQFANDSCFPGMGLGFIKDNTYGADIIKHEGALPGYVTTMFIIPKENLGIYICTNKMGPLPFNFEEEFKKEFYETENTLFSQLFNNRNEQKDYSMYEGHYRSYDGISKKSISKIFSLDEDTEIKDNKDGTLTLKEYTNEHTQNTTRLVEKEQNVFVREDNKGYYAFRLNEKGKVQYAFNNVSHSTFEKINILEYKEVIYMLMYGSIIIFFINAIVSIIFKIINRKKQKGSSLNKLININIISEILYIFGVLGVIFLSRSLMYFNDYYFNIFLIYVTLSMILIYVIISIIILLTYINFTYKKVLNKKNQIYWSLINVVNIIMISCLSYFNLIGFNLN